MPQTLTTTQIQQYIDSIQTGGLDQARLAYDALNAQGYNYAGWAAGVASGNSITGLSALSYLQGTALMGLGGDACRNLTQTQIDKIRVDMATGYLETLKAISIRDGGVADRDISYKEAEKFHETVFDTNGLSIDNWTLKTPMDLITQTQGADAAEKIWEHLRDTGGSGFDAIWDSTWLLNRIGTMMTSPDPDIARRAQQWMDTVPGPANWGQIKRFLDIYGSQFNGINDIDYNPMGDVDVISPTLGTTPDPLVKTIIYVDPLVLDLDGDGLEITPLSKGILFDANGDAVKTGTAWVGADDGLLVWDRNGNGTIDTGAELFGDETLLANGQKAAHGFAALSELDAGSLVNGITVGAGDGVFDTQDAQYNTLRIWRDLNQDGISQANELQTLAQNNFAREFERIEVSDAAKALPGLKGSWLVRTHWSIAITSRVSPSA